MSLRLSARWERSKIHTWGWCKWGPIRACFYELLQDWVDVFAPHFCGTNVSPQRRDSGVEKLNVYLLDIALVKHLCDTARLDGTARSREQERYSMVVEAFDDHRVSLLPSAKVSSTAIEYRSCCASTAISDIGSWDPTLAWADR